MPPLFIVVQAAPGINNARRQPRTYPTDAAVTRITGLYVKGVNLPCAIGMGQPLAKQPPVMTYLATDIGKRVIPMSPNTKGALLGLLGFGFFATHDVLVKYLGATYSPFQILFFSVIF